MEVQSLHAQQHRRSIPTEPVIPSVRGEFYSYSSEFSVDRPLAYLFKCKSNKSRSIEEAGHIHHEIDFVFVFGREIRACSPTTAPSVKLLDTVNADLGHTLIARAGITENQFYRLRQAKDGAALARVCREAVAGAEGIVMLSPGTILAVTTESGKNALLFVKEMTELSIKVDACHHLV
jgi:hypothetical protein